MSDGAPVAPADGATANVVDIKSRRAARIYVETPWGRMGLRKRFSVGGILACREITTSAAGPDGKPVVVVRDERESMLVLVQAGVAEPKLDRDTLEAMDEEDGPALIALFTEVTRALGLSPAETVAADRTFRAGDEAAEPVPGGSE